MVDPAGPPETKGVATAAIAVALDGLGQSFDKDVPARCSALLDELARWNRRMNLTAIRKPAAMVTAHLLDSLAARPLIEGERILDVGTGAGFPGIPLAIADPHRHFTLLDGNARKIEFVRHVTTLLGLANVTPLCARAEDYAPGYRFDTVIARAVAALPRLVELAGHHVGEGAVFIALKGRHPAEEVEQVPAGWHCTVTGLSVPGLEAGSRHAVLMRKRE